MKFPSVPPGPRQRRPLSMDEYAAFVGDCLAARGGQAARPSRSDQIPAVPFTLRMKITDNYKAKLAFWLSRPVAQALPRPVGLPPFKGVKFASHEEMNAWKREYRRRIAAAGGVRWTK